MRCIKCLNNLKKCRLIFGLCLVLLSLSFCLSGLLSPIVSALEPSSVSGYKGSSGFSNVIVNNKVPSNGTITADSSVANLFDIIVSPSNTFDYGAVSWSSPQFVMNRPLTLAAKESFYFKLNYSILLYSNPDAGVTPSALCLASTSYDNVNIFVTSCQDSTSSSITSVATSNISNTTLSTIVLEGVITNNNNSSYTLNRLSWAGKLLGGFGADYIYGYLLLSDIEFYNIAPSTSDAIQEQTQQQQDYHDQTQQTFDDAQDTADTDSDSSSQQATSSGTTLLAGFTSFVGALTGASASNCVINADLGNMDLGNIDLCQLSPPPAFQAISSIMVIGFTVPLSIALAKKMISLFRSFQT